LININELIIPFNERFKEAMLSGKKIKTSRNKKYGTVGETFKIFGGTFEITAIEKKTLQEIAEKHYVEEGCQSPEEFKNIWIKLHPIKGFEGEQEVFVHSFVRVD
jgi:hypothetical protein